MLTESPREEQISVSKRSLVWGIAGAVLLLAVAVSAFVYTKHVADVRNRRIAAAQHELDIYLGAEKQFQDLAPEYSSAEKQFSAAWSAAIAAGQRRHDLAFGSYWDLRTEYGDLQAEATNVSTMQASEENLFDIRQKDILIYTGLYGYSAVEKIRADEQTQEVLGRRWLSNWVNAISDMKDDDQGRLNGDDSSYNSSDVDHYYAQANDAENQLTSMEENVNADWLVLRRRLHSDLKHARANLRAAQHS